MITTAECETEAYEGGLQPPLTGRWWATTSETTTDCKAHEGGAQPSLIGRWWATASEALAMASEALATVNEHAHDSSS